MTKKAQQISVKDVPKAEEEKLESIDVDSLTSQARLAEDHEAYYPLAKQEHFRIGIVVIAAPDVPVAFRIEVLLQILAKNSRPRIADLERMNNTLAILSRRGYSLEHHDNCWVLCERTMSADDIEEEWKGVMAIIQPKRDVKTRSEEV